MPKAVSTAGKPYAEFGELLRKLRLRVGLTQAELAELSEVNHSYLSRLEGGDRKPSPRMLRKLAPALNYPYDELAISAGLLDREFHEQQPVASVRPDVMDALRSRMAAMQAARMAPSASQVAGATVPRRAVPLYDSVPAGVMKDANVVDATDDVPYIVLSEEELGWDPRAFALVVSGDSMVEAGILDGDVLIVSPNTRVQSGDIAVVSIERREHTVKKVYFDKGSILLQPCNSNFRPEVFNEREVEILGRVILVRRKL